MGRGNTRSLCCAVLCCAVLWADDCLLVYSKNSSESVFAFVCLCVRVSFLSKVLSPEGQTYYFHQLTRKTQWERPSAVMEAETQHDDDDDDDVAVHTPPVYIPTVAPVLSKKEEVHYRVQENSACFLNGKKAIFYARQLCFCCLLFAFCRKRKESARKTSAKKKNREHSN
jgi:hypothetical protein